MYDYSNSKKLIIMVTIIIAFLSVIYFLNSIQSDNITFSIPSGTYSEKLDLKLKTTGNKKIYYTTDSSIPTIESKLYKDSIEILKNEKVPTVINAIACSKDKCGESHSRIYFVGISLEISEFPILAFTTNPKNLFDEKYGIFTNYMNKGEKPCTLNYFNGDETFSQIVGLKIAGASNRDPYSTAPSFNLHARKEYDGKGKILFSFFDTAKKINSLNLRKRKPDYSGFLEYLVKDRNVSTQEYRKVNVFINNEYFGVFSLLEKYDEYYFKVHENIDEDHIAIVKNGTYRTDIKKAEDDIYSYSNMLDYLENEDLSLPEKYQHFEKMVNIQSLIDYYCIKIYINDIDYHIRKNVLIWKDYYMDENSSNSKWNWALFDLDATIYTYWKEEIDYTFNSFEGDFPYTYELRDDPFLNNLMVNKEFRELFIDSFIEIAENNFDIENVKSSLEKLENNNIDRFTEQQKDRLFTFFEKRYEYIVPYMYEYVRSFE